jgi:hypothetical protein
MRCPQQGKQFLEVQLHARWNDGPRGQILATKTAIALSATLLVIALLLAFVGASLLPKETTAAGKPDVFVGVDVGYGGENEVYKTAEAVAGYANLIIIGSLNVTQDTPALTRVCDYLYQRDFYFIIYIGFATDNFLPPRGPDPQFFNATAGRWGDKFLGFIFSMKLGESSWMHRRRWSQ